MTPWLAARAVVDRGVGALASVVLAGPVVALAWWIRRADGGPGHVTVTRVGRHGRTFGMFKLRTMRVAGTSGRAGGPPLTLVGDTRITPIGATLRRWRLDELPQLANVVAGQMALIGPRPEDPAFVDTRDALWREILAARPAMIGPTQFLVAEWETTLPGVDEYRDEILPVKKAIDAWYVRTASPGLDLLVLGAVGRQLLGRPQSPLRARVLREVPESARIPT